ncbi:MAG TPA: FUSC family protein, partial [Candidatus Binataceae bacterium]|nr:FUSC family protein [Candidatus Binataceae bacterium]
MKRSLFADRLWQDVTRLVRSEISTPLALRNSIGLVVPLALATWLGRPFAGLAGALGALNVALSDGDDFYASRAGRMIVSAICVTLSVFVGSITGNSAWLAIVAAALWSIAGGLMVVVGPQAAQVGIVSVILLIVFAGQPASVAQSAVNASWALGGGMLEIILAAWPWRSRSFHAIVLAEAFRTLATHTRIGLKDDESIPAVGEMTEAHHTLTGISSNFSRTIETYRALLNQGERIRLELVALRHIRIQLGGKNSDAIKRERLRGLALAAADVLEQTANWLIDPDSPKGDGVLSRYEEAARALRAAFVDDGNGLKAAAAGHVLALSGQIRAVIKLQQIGLGYDKRRSERTPVPSIDVWLKHHVETLRANLSLRSAGSRHAIRLAACVAIAEIWARTTRSRFGFWIPMTAAIVLKPDFAGTFGRGLARFIGTFAGMIVASVLLRFVFGMKLVCIGLCGILMFAMRSVGRANYTLMVGSITALILILLTFLGAPPAQTVMLRGEQTIIGGGIALLSIALWPTWESKLTPLALADLCDALK